MMATAFPASASDGGDAEPGVEPAQAVTAQARMADRKEVAKLGDRPAAGSYGGTIGCDGAMIEMGGTSVSPFSFGACRQCRHSSHFALSETLVGWLANRHRPTNKLFPLSKTL